MSASDEDQIRTIFETILPSKIRAHDIPGYVSLYAQDGMWCPPDAPDRKGPAEITSGVTAILVGGKSDPTFTADEVKVLGSFGYVLGRATIKVTPQDGGPPAVFHTRELWHFRKEDDAWKIAVVVFNSKPA